MKTGYIELIVHGMNLVIDYTEPSRGEWVFTCAAMSSLRDSGNYVDLSDEMVALLDCESLLQQACEDDAEAVADAAACGEF